MILFGLIFTILLLVVTLPLGLGGLRYSAVCIVCIVAAGLGLVFMGSLLAVINAAFVLAVACLCGCYRLSYPVFAIGSLVASGLAYVVIAFVTISVDFDQENARQGLREQYPIESLDQRLAYEEPARSRRGRAEGSSMLSPATLAQLERVEEQIKPRVNGFRNFMLERLHTMHKGTLERFVDSPGFGVRRRIQPTESNLRLPEGDPLPLPVADDYLIKLHPDQGSAKPGDKEPIEERPVPRSQLVELHQESTVGFINAEGFGWIPERKRAAGFQSHRFKEMPWAVKELREAKWEILRVELVSLLKHETPGVYLSRHLPRMDELRDAPTRSLNPFETSGLAALQGGEELKFSIEGDHLRMMGSIRAAKACLKCHDVQRGDLLGAFSYLLRKATRLP